MSEQCDACGLEYSDVYRLPDELFAKIYHHMTGGVTSGGGLLCMSCAKMPKAYNLYWEGAEGEYPTTTLRARNKKLEEALGTLSDEFDEVDLDMSPVDLEIWTNKLLAIARAALESNHEPASLEGKE